MTVNDAISKLRVMLGAATEEVKEVNMESYDDDKKKKKVEMAEATLVDGTEVYAEGEIQPGAILFVRAGEGADEDPFAPEGKHETTSGLLITVGESGEITNVEDKGSEETVSEAEETFEEEEEVIVKEKDFDVEGMLEGIATMLEPYRDEIKELKEELSVLTSRFNEVADEPAAKKVRNTFSQEKINKQSTAEARFERLVALRQNSRK
tara:strand:- start:2034 stop:2657 length:624 start_codon:yes stop_codon:yes gene_type:complete